MKINLSSNELFDNDELDLDKNITFIFGKNGTGKSTIASEIVKLNTDYNVQVFQGFANIIDENKRLNAVALGVENSSINSQINQQEEFIKELEKEKEIINRNLQPVSNSNESNYFTRKKEAGEKHNDLKKEIDQFYRNSASKLKSLENLRIFPVNYNKNSFKNDISKASLLNDDEVQKCENILKTDVKIAQNLDYPEIDFQKVREDTINILMDKVEERVRIARLENNNEKREFAKSGLRIHKIGDVCAFCGNKITSEAINELRAYFSADDVKKLENDILLYISKLDVLLTI